MLVGVRGFMSRAPVQCLCKTRQPYRCYARDSGTSTADANPLLRYIRSLKWVPIPLSVGFAYICYQQYGHVVKREQRKMHAPPDHQLSQVAQDWQVQLYRALPLNVISRLWGKINSMELPVFLRRPLYKAYIKAFGCNVEEAAIQDLDYYRTLGEFFRRRLRPGCRPIDKKALLTSPSDGRILHFGCVEGSHVEQVKGVTYPLSEFLGPLSFCSKDESTKENEYVEAVKQNKANCLYHCVVYLAPGDYHGFHSPSQWTVTFRRHFPGDLLSVSEFVARRVQGLFNFNERAVYFGTWEHGFFAMAAVGATNVGSIKVYHDKSLDTNTPVRHPSGFHLDQKFDDATRSGIPMRKGESFGEFNLGSTIVLVFEAPEDFTFHISQGQKIKVGQRLGSVSSNLRGS